jgi:hypothetical protein
MRMPRTAFLATLAAGIGLLGAAFHGITSVDHQLQAAVATPAAPQPPDFVGEDCPAHRHHHRGPEV